MLDWASLPPVQRIELMTNHDLAKREKQKLELLRNLLTYFHYASLETRADVYQSEIDGVRRATEAVKERLRTKQLEDPTDVVHIRHPDIGDVYLHPNRFNIPHSGGQHMLTYRAEPGSESAAALEALRSLAAAGPGQGG